ncbi:hypothetical protein [Lactococcus lactis]|uniref:hypothetical protein n=1 Tax=Lactococcus lactis TaxID=1358 RepID=UPI002260F464|nr:hypothetical protein [Lactococcus lactis]MCX7529626.1 hypothetical protein [Lactococcus lactis]MDM7472648.1 hypothetical protein [Lactococcus lactis]
MNNNNNNKLTLNDNTVKLGGVNLDKNNFDIPKKYQVNFAKARFSKDGNKAILQALDAGTVLVLEKAGVDLSQLKPITIEVYGGLDELQDYKDEEKEAVIECINPQVRLLWDMGMSSWRGVKLVTDKITLSKGE